MRLDSPFADLPTALPAAGTLPLGEPRLDAALNGGLRTDGLHEFHAAETVDAVSALGFALLVARLRGDLDGRPLIWARQDDALGVPYGPGLVELGVDPDAVTLLMLPDGKALLRAGLDCVRDGAAAAVLLELHGKQPLLDLTVTRRLALAGAQSETMVLIARSAGPAAPSAAHTRWQVAAAPSQPLPADAPGYPAFALTLLRHRGGREGLAITLEWNRDAISFRELSHAERAPLPGALPAVAAGGASDPQRQGAG